MSRIVVTAKMLDDLRREGREVVVPDGALITPAARDWFRDNAYPVTFSDGPADASGRAAKLGVAGNLAQPGLRSLRTEIERIAGRLEVFDAGSEGTTQLAALRRLCGAVQRGELNRGLALTEDGAIPTCVANKFRGIRACVGSNVSGVDQAVRELGINVLVIEYPDRTFHEMRQMIRKLVAGDGQTVEAVGRAIAAAEVSDSRCA